MKKGLRTLKTQQKTLIEIKGGNKQTMGRKRIKQEKSNTSGLFARSAEEMEERKIETQGLHALSLLSFLCFLFSVFLIIQRANTADMEWVGKCLCVLSNCVRVHCFVHSHFLFP